MSPFAAFRHFSWVLCVSLLPDSVRRFCLVAIYLCFDGLPPREECPETNYIGQSVAGMLIFYGTGLGWGTSQPAVHGTHRGSGIQHPTIFQQSMTQTVPL